MIEPLKLPIKPTYEMGSFAKDQARLKKELGEVDKATEKMGGSMTKFFAGAGKGFQSMGKGMLDMKLGMNEAFSGTLRGIDRLNAGFDKVSQKLFTIKNLAIVTFAGAAVQKLFRMGQEGLRSQARLAREFGDDAPMLERLVSRVAKRSARDDDSVREGIREIAAAMDPIRAGRFYKGGAFGDKYARGGTLSQGDADILRQRNLENTVRLYERAATIARDLDPAELGKRLADAAGGIEGAKGLAKYLGLQKSTYMPLIEAADKGKLYDALSESERRKFGVEKGQGFMPGQLVDIIMSKGRLTGKAADAFRGTAEFDREAAKVEVGQRLQDVGERLIKSIDKIAGGKLSGAVTAGAEFIGNNAGLLGGAVGAFGLLRTIGAFRKGKGGLAGGIAGGLSGAAGAGGAIPVYVTNMGGGGLLGGSSGSRELDLLGEAGKGGLLKGARGALGGLLASGGTSVGAATAGAILGYGLLGAGIGAGTGLLLNKYAGTADSLAGTGDFSMTGRNAIDLEQSRKGKGMRVLSLARSLAERVNRGELSSDEAASAFSSGRGGIEGGKSSELSGWALTQLRRGNADAIRQAQSSVGNLNIDKIEVSLPMGNDPAQQVRLLMPELERQLIQKVRTATAGGAAPAIGG